MTLTAPEELARSIDGGHWLTIGLAGSGKTAALVARARHLRRTRPDWRILLVCFNKALASSLAELVPADHALEVSTFHDWALDRLVRAALPVRTPARGKEWDVYWSEEVPKLLLRAIDEGRPAAREYQAILVDEGQDFAPGWYRALLRALDAATNELVIALDPSQNNYGRAVDWPAVGIDPTGRTRVLPVGQRHVRPFLSEACQMVSGVDGPELRAAAGGALPFEPSSRDRAPLELVRSRSFDVGRRHALDWIHARLARGVRPHDILVLGLSRLDMMTVNAWLNSQNIAAWLVGETAHGKGLRVSTIHSSKGLDADHVLLLDAHLLETREAAEARRLLYVALTRSNRELCVCSLGQSRLIGELARVARLS